MGIVFQIIAFFIAIYLMLEFFEWLFYGKTKK